MNFRIEFELAGLPKNTNTFRHSGHWVRYRHDEEWKAAIAAKCAGHPRPSSPLEKYRLCMIRFSSVESDFDGLVSSFKVIVDSLKVLGFIANDKLSNSGAWDCRWEKCKPKQGKIRVIVETKEEIS